MKSKNRIFIIIGIIVVVFGLGAGIAKWQGWIGKEESTEVTVADAKPITIVEKVSASGKIQPETEVKISPDVSGEIIELNVEEGDSVIQGQLLCRIRPDNYQSLLDRAVASLSSAKAQASQVKAGYLQAQLRFKRAEQDYNRQSKLFDQKVISESDYEISKNAYEVAKQEIESAKANLEGAEYSIESSEAAVKDARETLRKTAIYAPMSGIVSKLAVEKGERVVGTATMTGTEMMRIANLNRMEVLIDVNENDIVKLSLGDSCDIDVDSYNQTGLKFKGLVTSIANTAKTAATLDVVTEFEVKVLILNSSYASLIDRKTKKYPFRPGMTASVDIITDKKENVLSVPLAAVATRNTNAEFNKKDGKGKDDKKAKDDKAVQGSDKDKLEEVVFIYDKGKAVQRKVVTGISDFDNIEIKSGIKSGDKVISGPFMTVSKQLNDGDKVSLQGEKKNEGSKISFSTEKK